MELILMIATGVVLGFFVLRIIAAAIEDSRERAETARAHAFHAPKDPEPEPMWYRLGVVVMFVVLFAPFYFLIDLVR